MIVETGNRIPQYPVDYKIPQVMTNFLFNSLHLFSDNSNHAGLMAAH